MRPGAARKKNIARARGAAKFSPRARPAQFRGVPARSNQGTAGFPDGRDPRRGVRDDLPPARGAEGAGEAACGNFLGEGDPREYLGNVVKSQGRAFITTWPGSCNLNPSHSQGDVRSLSHLFPNLFLIKSPPKRRVGALFPSREAMNTSGYHPRCNEWTAGEGMRGKGRVFT